MNSDLELAKEQVDQTLREFLLARNTLGQKGYCYNPGLRKDKYGEVVLESSEVTKL